jgi:hypothetical protein
LSTIAITNTSEFLMSNRLLNSESFSATVIASCVLRVAFYDWELNRSVFTDSYW